MCGSRGLSLKRPLTELDTVPEIRHADDGPDCDRSLALQAASGCRSAFSALIERHYDHVFRLAWRFCGQREQAEDIAHDVCLKLARAIAGYRGDAAFSTWLYRIVFTTATDHLRAGQRLQVSEPAHVAALVESSSKPQPETPEDLVIKDEIWLAVRDLSPQQRQAVLLVYGEDFAHAEAAEVLGCSEKTVSWHLHEAKKRLRCALQATG